MSQTGTAVGLPLAGCPPVGSEVVGSPPDSSDVSEFPPLPDKSCSGATVGRPDSRAAGRSARGLGAIPKNRTAVPVTAGGCPVASNSDSITPSKAPTSGGDASKKIAYKRSKPRDAIVLTSVDKYCPPIHSRTKKSVVGVGSGVSAAMGTSASTNLAPGETASTSVATSSSSCAEASALPRGNVRQPSGVSDGLENEGDQNDALRVPSGKPPEIYVYNAALQHVEISDMLSVAVGHRVYGNIRGKEELIVYRMADFKAHRIATDLLSREGFESHTYPFKGQRPIKVLIKGLAHGTNLDDIKLWVNSLGYRTVRAWRIGDTSLFVVVLAPCLGVEGVYQERYLGGLRVRFESYKEPEVPRQCHRCQRFGHASEFCTTRPRCVKCGHNHLSTDCKKPRTVPARCANCHGSHTANFRSCPTFKQAALDLNRRRRHDNIVAADHVRKVRKSGPTKQQDPWTEQEQAAAELSAREVCNDVVASESATKQPKPTESTVLSAPASAKQPAPQSSKPKKRKTKKAKNKTESQPQRSKQQTKGPKPAPSQKTHDKHQSSSVGPKEAPLLDRGVSGQVQVISGLVVGLPEAEQQSADADLISSRNDKASSDAVVQANSQSNSSFRDDLAELMTLCKTYNISALIRTAKLHLAQFAKTSDPVERMGILMEAVNSIGELIDG